MDFEVQFSSEKAPSLVANYKEDAEEMCRENKAFGAGKLISEGKRTKDQLITIVEWKSLRTVHLVCENSEDDVADALRLCISAETERAAMAVLTGLRGVATSMASAILTAVDRERFTIIDFRALEALGTEKQSPTIDYYLGYLKFCRLKAEEYDLTLRDFDRALWQWSKGPGRSN